MENQVTAGKATEIPRDKAYFRSMRRIVRAPVHRFAAIVPPELAPLCQAELRQAGLPETVLSEAGVEFAGKLAACYLSNLWLRTASRILCRLPEFRAGVTEELFHKASALRWDCWLNPRIALHIEAHVLHSRIQHEGLVADTLFAAIRKCYQMQGMASPQRWSSDSGEVQDGVVPHCDRQKVIVHLRKNRCQISLDTSGAHLHQRGYRLQHLGAPLRETLAVAILIKMGWQGERPLVDGMCGSGTVAIEAALMARRMPPGMHRSFMFQQWPSFQQKTWEFLCRKAGEDALKRSPAPIIAVDLSARALGVAHQNAERAGVEKDIMWRQADLFSFQPKAFDLPAGLLVVNPPYGKRLEGGGKLFFEQLGNHLRGSFRGWQVAVLVPERALAMRLRLRSARYWPIVHGGLPIVVALARL